MKHLVVKPKSSFERFKPAYERIKGLKVFKSHKIHYCDGSTRGKYKGKDYRHPRVPMHHSGFAQSGKMVRISRFECKICGAKRTFGRET